MFIKIGQLLELIKANDVLQAGVSQPVKLRDGNSSALFNICEIISNLPYNTTKKSVVETFIKEEILTKWPVFKELRSSYHKFQFDKNYHWVVSFYTENEPLQLMFDSYEAFNNLAEEAEANERLFATHISRIKQCICNHLAHEGRSIDLLIDCLNTMMKKPEELEITVGNEHLIWASIQALLNYFQKTQNKPMERKLRLVINGMITRNVFYECFDLSKKTDLINEQYNERLNQLKQTSVETCRLPKQRAKIKRIKTKSVEEYRDQMIKMVQNRSPIEKLNKENMEKIAEYLGVI